MNKIFIIFVLFVHLFITGCCTKGTVTTNTSEINTTNSTKTIITDNTNGIDESNTVYPTNTVNSTNTVNITNTKNNIIINDNLIMIDDIGLELVKCPAGNFMMGTSKGEQEAIKFCLTCEVPQFRRFAYKYNDIELYEKQHLVKITKPFFIGKYEVTQKQYKAIMGDNPSKFKGENKPVECVDALDAGRFCDKLNQKYSSLLPNNYRFDLPTEAQWEYACRAGTTTPYNNPISYKSSSQEFYIELGEIAWFDWNSKGETYDVGLKKPNLWEIYDMHGNVWEWCRDEYKRDYDKYMIDPCVFSGLGDSFGDNVVRGGSFCNHYLFLRSAFRGYEYGGSEKNFIGFRVALVPID